MWSTRRCDSVVCFLSSGSGEAPALLAEIGDYNKLADLLYELLQDSDLSSNLTQNAYHNIRKYNIKETSKRVEELYKKALSIV